MRGSGSDAGMAVTRRQLLRGAAVGGGLLLVPSRLLGGQDALASVPPDSVVLAWNDALLQGVRAAKLGPPMVARALAITHTSMYDAWAAYDRTAVGTRLGAGLRRPAGERVRDNVMQAISFAAYRAAADLFPGSVGPVFDPLMQTLGYDPADASTDTSTPVGVGNVAAGAVLEFRHSDGANQLGDEPGGPAGVPYSDYTGFTPVNAPMDLRAPFDRTTVADPNAWQQLRYVDAAGNVVTPGFLAPHWQNVTPFSPGPISALRSPTGPARADAADFRRQAHALLRLSAALTDRQKMLAEYWADGPSSETPAGHWNLFGQFVARRDAHGAGLRGIEQDVKLFFALTNALLDASCCAWDNKRAFGSVRPITAVRYVFGGQIVPAWAGPGQGTQDIDGAAWLPYQASTFPTPPFPEFSSGHSTFSAAGAEVLRRFTNSDAFGAAATLATGSSKVEPGLTPSHDVRLSWATFTAAADEAGLSRRFGGIHFEQGDLDARAVGKVIGRTAWQTARGYWEGNPVSPTAAR